MKEFIEKIIQTLKTNGFPEKRISLPTEKMYEAADNKGFSFNVVLQQLKEEHNIEAQIGSEKIIFSQVTVEMPFAGMNQEELIKQAQEMMSQMDPEELRKMQEMFSNMSPEEKEDVLKKGKDLGLI
jgi:ferredoxin-NADP reductase